LGSIEIMRGCQNLKRTNIKKKKGRFTTRTVKDRTGKTWDSVLVEEKGVHNGVQNTKINGKDEGRPTVFQDCEHTQKRHYFSYIGEARKGRTIKEQENQFVSVKGGGNRIGGTERRDPMSQSVLSRGFHVPKGKPCKHESGGKRNWGQGGRGGVGFAIQQDRWSRGPGVGGNS